MLNEAEEDQLRQLIEEYSLSDVLRGIEAVSKHVIAASYRMAGRAGMAGAWEESAAIVGRAAADVFGKVG